MLHPFLGKDENVSISASSGGGVYGVWQLPTGFHTLTVNGSRVHVTAENIYVGHLAPGPDGRTVFTAVGRRRSVDEPIDRVVVPGKNLLADVTIPSADPSLYLSVSGFPGDVAGTEPLQATATPPPRDLGQ